MTALHTRLFDLAGCVLRFGCADEELADRLAEDFGAFPAAPGAVPEISITAVLAAPGRARPAALLGTAKWSILSAPPGRRLVWYPEGALCEYDYRARRGRVTSADAGLLWELSYLLLLSRAGEALDLRGLHRLHAGALGFGGRALLLCGAQRAGKTTLGLELLKDKDFSLLSDDTPLIAEDGTVHGFPARIGLGGDSPHLKRFALLRAFTRRHYPPKQLLDIRGSGLELSPPLPPSYIFKLYRGSRPALRRPAAGEGAWELTRSLVAGWGVPQMAEYFLRLSPGDLCSKARILAARVKAARALGTKAQFWIFETGPDHAANAAALKAFLRSGSAPA
ncbi:MAG: hypothetical protein NTY45_02260 [Elusimicrobia bacterium]|nr:hypothetical protein [Elusimicrobiota bacterium]